MVLANVVPGPAIESAVLHMGCVVRNQIVAERVAFVHCSPKLAGLWLYSQAHGIANA